LSRFGVSFMLGPGHHTPRQAGTPHECAGEPAHDQEAVNSVGG
jgi:hypothetical protein